MSKDKQLNDNLLSLITLLLKQFTTDSDLTIYEDRLKKIIRDDKNLLDKDLETGNNILHYLSTIQEAFIGGLNNSQIKLISKFIEIIVEEDHSLLDELNNANMSPVTLAVDFCHNSVSDKFIDHGYTKIAIVLLKLGANPNTKLYNDPNSTLLSEALKNKNDELLAELLKSEALIVTKNNEHEICKKIVENIIKKNNISEIDRGLVDKLLKAPDIVIDPMFRYILNPYTEKKRNLTYVSSVSILYWSIFKGYKNIVELLLKEKDISPEYKGQALYNAANEGHIDLVELLLKEKDILPKSKGQALCNAANKGYKDIVELVLKQKDISPEYKGQALYNAANKGYSLNDNARTGYKDIVKFLIKQCINYIPVKYVIETFSKDNIREDKNLIKTLVKYASYSMMSHIIKANILSPSFLKDLGFTAMSQVINKLTESVYMMPDKNYDHPKQNRDKGR